MTHLTTHQLEAWDRDGYLHVPAALDQCAVDDLRSWTVDIAGRRNGDGGILQHYEATGNGAQIARSENLLPVHPGFHDLIASGLLPEMGAELVREPVVIYKEKINYKLPGGAGFAPHQDAPAYKFVDVHLTCMVAIDDSNLDNGCMEVVAGAHGELLPEDDGVIAADVVAGFDWKPVPVAAGDLLWFHSRVPHRSGTNTSEQTRRGLFCTYNAASQGDLRTAYYADKLRYFADGGHDTARVSTVGDFEGTAPTEEQLREIGAL